MPKMDGFAFCRECKRDGSLKRIPFIFYTATYTDKKDEEFALSLGAEKFMVKPLEPDKFLEILQGVIKEYEQGILVATKKPAEEEVLLAQYNKRLIEKLEHKALNLEKEITERKRIEDEVRKSRDFLQTVINGIPDQVLVVHPDYRIVLTNQAVCESTEETDPISNGM